MRLETEQGHHVADVEPVILGAVGLLPDTVAIWGARVFVKATEKQFGDLGPAVWRETLPLVVHDGELRMPTDRDALEELAHIAYDAFRVTAGGQTLMAEWLQLDPALREPWRAAADAVAMLLQLRRPDNPAHVR